MLGGVKMDEEDDESMCEVLDQDMYDFDEEYVPDHNMSDERIEGFMAHRKLDNYEFQDWKRK